MNEFEVLFIRNVGVSNTQCVCNVLCNYVMYFQVFPHKEMGVCSHCSLVRGNTRVSCGCGECVGGGNRPGHMRRHSEMSKVWWWCRQVCDSSMIGELAFWSMRGCDKKKSLTLAGIGILPCTTEVNSPPVIWVLRIAITGCVVVWGVCYLFSPG